MLRCISLFNTPEDATNALLERLWPSIRTWCHQTVLKPYRVYRPLTATPSSWQVGSGGQISSRPLALLLPFYDRANKSLFLLPHQSCILLFLAHSLIHPVQWALSMQTVPGTLCTLFPISLCTPRRGLGSSSSSSHWPRHSLLPMRQSTTGVPKVLGLWSKALSLWSKVLDLLK